MRAQRASSVPGAPEPGSLTASKAERIARAKAQIGFDDHPFYRNAYAADFTLAERFECLVATAPRFAYAHACYTRELALPHAERLALWRVLAVHHENTPAHFHRAIPANGPDDIPLTQAERYEIAKLMATSGHGMADYLPTFELTEEQHWHVLQLLAAHSSLGPVYTGSRSNFEWNDRRAARVRALGTRNGFFSSSTFPLQNERRQVTVAKIAVRNLTTDHWLQHGRDFSKFGTAEADVIVPHLVARAPLQRVMKYSGVPELSDIADMPTETLKSQLATYAEAHPTRIQPAAVQLAWDTVQRNEVGCVLVRYAMQLFEHSGAMPAHSRDVLSQTTGLPLERTGKLSQETANEVYSFLTEMQPRVSGPLFAGITFAPELLANKRLPEIKALLLAARDNFMLAGGTDESWRHLKRTFLHADLTSANIGEASAAIEADTVRRIGSMFEADGITAESLRDITRRWGTLETFLTLVARFNGTEGWAGCVPALGRILSAEAAGTFASFKFQGFEGDTSDADAARNQLAVLTHEEQRRAWMTSRCSALIYDGETGLSIESVWERVKEEAWTTLMVHMRLQPTTNAWVVPTREACTSSGDPRPVVAGLLARGTAAEVAAALKSEMTSLLWSPEPQVTEFRRALTLLQLTIASDASLFEDAQQQIRNDITSLMVAMKPGSVERRESVVVNAVVNDARTLLELGDIVRTSSCQNYKTGSHANNLPGYVIDANVQAIVSFAPTAEDFASRADYEAVVAGVRAGTARVELEPGKRTIGFTLADGRELSTRSIPYAYRRSVLKLGVTDSGAPGLFLERPYVQTHSAEVAMERAQQALMHEVAAEIGAQTHVPMTCKQTRNPGGIYSDAARGAQKRDYRVG